MTETVTPPVDATPAQAVAPAADAAPKAAVTDVAPTLLDAAKVEEKPADRPADRVIPDSYEFKAADGYEYDPVTIGELGKAAKELGLTQAEAQGVLDKMGPALVARNQELLASVREGWVNASKADKEFGGQNLDRNLSIAKTAYEKMATPELKAFLSETGLGNHPEIIRLMYRVGSQLTDEKVLVSEGSPSKAMTAKDLYSNSKLN